MWEQYVEKARIEMAELEGRALEIRFEDLLADPQPAIAAIAEFCGTAVNDDTALVELVSGRAHAFRRDPALVAFAEENRDILVRYAYTP